MKLSVIIPVLIYNEYLWKMTIQCVENLRFFSYPHEIELIIIHNQSQLFPEVQKLIKEGDIYIPHPNKNERIGKCLNEGIAKATSDYLVNLSNDVLVHQDFLEHPLKLLDEGKASFVIPFAEVSLKPKDVKDYADTLKDGMVACQFSSGFGNCAVFLRKYYEKMGAFDENLVSCCDRDYNMRPQRQEIPPCVTSYKSFVTHLGSMTWHTREGRKMKLYLITKALTIMSIFRRNGEKIVSRYSHTGKDAIFYFNPKINIGDFTAIADNVTFCGAMNYPYIQDKKNVNAFPFGNTMGGDYQGGNTRGDINIGNDVWIGYKACILDGVTIGDGAIVGAFSVVAKDVPPYAVVVGNPAEIKHYRYTPEQIEKLLKIKWWLWEDKLIMERIRDFKDIDIFLQKYGN